MKTTELLKMIETKKFVTSLFGYKTEDVNNFLENISLIIYEQAIEVDKLTNELEEEKSKNKSLNNQLEQIKFELQKSKDIINTLKNDTNKDINEKN